MEEYINASGSTITPDAFLLTMPVEAVFLQGGTRGSLRSLSSPSTAFEIEHPNSPGHTVRVGHLSKSIILSDPSLAVDEEKDTWSLVDSLGSLTVCEMPHRAVHPDDKPLVLVVPKEKEYRLEEYIYSASLFDQASSQLFQCDQSLLRDVDLTVTRRPSHTHSHYPEDEARKHSARTAFVLCHLYRVLNSLLSVVKGRFCSPNDYVNYDRKALLGSHTHSSG